MEEIIAKYVKYSTMASEENLVEDRDIAMGNITISETKWLEELEKLAVEKIIAKYVNYSTMASGRQQSSSQQLTKAHLTVSPRRLL